MTTIPAAGPTYPALRRASAVRAFGRRLLRVLSGAFLRLAAHAERRERRVPYY